MARIVEHEERRHDILEKALDVFIDEGFDDTTFQKIADRAKVARTALYQYFSDKLEIFHFSIKQFMKDIEENITLIIKKDISSTEKLTEIMHLIALRLEKNRGLLTAVLNFLVNDYDNVEELNYHIKRRTIKFRHILTGLIIDGIQARELRRVKISVVNDMLFGLIKLIIFELTIFKQTSVENLLPAITLNIELLKQEGF